MKHGKWTPFSGLLATSTYVLVYIRVTENCWKRVPRLITLVDLLYHS
jgi:hypothetical protein